MACFTMQRLTRVNEKENIVINLTQYHYQNITLALARSSYEVTFASSCLGYNSVSPDFSGFFSQKHKICS